MSKEAMKLALETAEGILNADWRKWDELASPAEFERWAKSRAYFMATILREALAEQPAQQEPVFCEHCGGNDEDPQDHCMDCTRPRWEPVTQELLNNQHPWLYEPMWIATKGGTVIQGHYEWRQGRNPDRFITDDGDDWAFDFAYVMPMVKPTHPDKEKP